METISPNKAGIVLGLLLGGWHALWAALVALGWAQEIANFIFWIHMIKPVYVVEEFRLWIALILVAVTSCIGYIMGSILAALWNWIHRSAV